MAKNMEQSGTGTSVLSYSLFSILNFPFSPQSYSMSLYPAPLTVSRCCGFAGSRSIFLRSWRM